MITRFTSRLQQLDHHFLDARLKGALAYDRIAGFFSSSILEVAGEALEGMAGPVRVVCNSVVDAPATWRPHSARRKRPCVVNGVRASRSGWRTRPSPASHACTTSSSRAGSRCGCCRTRISA